MKDRMLASVCHQFGPPESLVMEEVAVPQPATDEVLIKVAAAGVNFADLLMVAGRYQVKPPLPFIPGLEFSGTIAAVGSAVQDWRLNDRVMGAPMLGGGFAQYICMPAQRLFAVPPETEMTLELAAGLLIGYGTATYSLVQRANIQAGETVLITGAGGGVGIAAVEVAKALGARVIAAAGSPAKLAAAIAHGADEGVNYASGDLRASIDSLTAGRGVDVLIDIVGGAVFESSLRCVARYGRIVLVGFASGEIPRIRAEYLLIKNLVVLGAGFGASLTGEMSVARKTIADVLAINKRAPLRLERAARMGLAEVPAALQRLADRQVQGKLLIAPDAG